MRLAKKLGITSVGLAIGLAGVGLPSAAQALQFNFSYTAGGVTTNALLTTNNTSDGSGFYTVTGITGTRGTDNITALSTFNTANNLFNPNAPYLTGGGLSYIFGSGSTASAANIRLTQETVFPSITSNVTNMTAVPEPSDIGGLAILVGMGGLMIRKFKTSKKTTTFLAETKKETLVS